MSQPKRSPKKAAHGEKARGGAASKSAGRPSKWQQDFVRQAYELALLGHTDEEMARVLGVSVSVFNEYKERPGFLRALKDGRAPIDGKVAAKLLERAMGYNHESVKIFNNAGVPLVVPFVEHYPPDVTACIFWLKNRHPKLWRDRHEVDHSGEVEVAGLPADVLGVMRRLAADRARTNAKTQRGKDAKEKPDGRAK